MTAAGGEGMVRTPRPSARYLSLVGSGWSPRSLPKYARVSIIEEIGGLSELEKMTTRSSSMPLLISSFVRTMDSQKLTCSSVWDEERASRSHSPVKVANGRTVAVHDRSSAHVAAWYSPKRPQT
jgi:hypothetical protein